MSTIQLDSEQKIERLVSELGQIVRSADPEKQEELKEFASSLVDQEFVPIEESTRTAQRLERRSMNPLAAGLGLLVLAAGLFMFLPAVAIVLGIFGLIGVMSGFARSANSHP